MIHIALFILQARVADNQEYFLINPYGLLYKEVTAGSLVKVDIQGNTIAKGNTAFDVNRASSVLHTSIYAARPDVNCVIHIRSSSTVGVGTNYKRSEQSQTTNAVNNSHHHSLGWLLR